MKAADKALEVLLADELARRSPPDLSQRILTAVANRSSTHSLAAVVDNPKCRSTNRAMRAGWLGIALGGLAASALWILPDLCAPATTELP